MNIRWSWPVSYTASSIWYVEEQVLSITAKKLGKKGKIHDLWRQRDIGHLRHEFSVKENAHDTTFLKSNSRLLYLPNQYRVNFLEF